MASWTDGPEYAPTERPAVFVEPDAPPLQAAEPVEAPSTSSGNQMASSGNLVAELVEAPTYTAPDAPALDTLVPAAAPQRDPQEAFDVATTPMTSWSAGALPPPEGEPVPLAPPPPESPGQSAWGHAHAPQVSLGAPQVSLGAPPMPAPPHWSPQPAPYAQRSFEPVTVATTIRNATPGLMICLAIGGIVTPFSLALLVVASVLATRVRHRRRLVARIFSGAIVGSFALGMVGMLGRQGVFDPIGWYDASTGWAQVGCLLLLVVVPLVIGDAMRRSEAPEESR